MGVRSDWEALLRILSPRSGQRILDVGAGKGSLASIVSRFANGVEVYAIDPNDKRVAGIKRDHPEVKASTAGAESLPFPNAFFDKIYTTMALHHYADLDKALGEVVRVLKSGGSFIVLEVEPGSAKGTMFRLFGRITGEHTSLMTEQELAARLGNSKELKVVSSAKAGSGYLLELARI